MNTFLLFEIRASLRIFILWKTEGLYWHFIAEQTPLCLLSCKAIIQAIIESSSAIKDKQ